MVLAIVETECDISKPAILEIGVKYTETCEDDRQAGGPWVTWF